ncbi:MAG: DNA repair protein RadA, partial [Anaerolinea sp.]|nr:DNA repair protein RadA [Anaerolinea sp.]
MPSRTQSKFVCQNCGRQSPRYMGRCPACGEFNTMVEEFTEVTKVGGKTTTRERVVLPHSQPQRLNDVSTHERPRLQIPIGEFNRVMGGGIVPGSIVLIGGEPGIGKSTIVLQMSSLLANNVGRVLYVSGEESVQQIKMRADRMGLQADELYLLTETNLADIFEQVNRVDPTILIIDSIQTIYTEESESSPGSVSQVRECASRLQMLAKTTGTSVFMIGHVTKEGAIAGPRVLEHIVDTVLYLEGDPFQAYRLLRSVKNRFGATSEIGVFEMSGLGMIEVPNPSEVFLAERVLNAPGTAIAVTMEGTRPLLVELQALTSPTAFGNPRRTPNGVDMNRLLLISAVLTKRLGLKLHEHDIFINVVGGMKVDEPASDLSMALALASSYYEKAIPT